MEVTCERCSTVYDFDDALVSERGTTVKCTTCGHQFKVRRAGGAAVPEKWTVRTVDGRELDFAALRELQAAIHDGKISRDDVLSRGNSRPRRLGSIAELEPFFSRMAMTVPGMGGTTPPPPGVRSRSRTPAGLGSAAPTPGPTTTTETSAIFTLPAGLRAATAAQAAAEAAAAQAPQPTGRRSSVPPPPMPVGGRRNPSVKPPAAAQAPRANDPLAMPAAPRVPSGLEDLTTIDAPTVAIGVDKASRAAATAPATASPMFPPAAASPMFPPVDAPEQPAPPPARTQISSSPVLPAPETPEPQPAPSARKAAQQGGRDRASGASSGVEGNPSSGRERPPVSMGRPPASAIPSGPVSSRASLGPNDEALSDPRFSGPVRRGGAGRWIVGLLVAGLAVFAAVTVGRKYLPETSTTAPQQADARIATLLEQGERDLREGDLEAAKESLDKASALSDKDPKVAVRLAQLAAVRADIPWLHVRLLPEGDPDLVNVRRELDIAVTRARQAADRAQALAPGDPEVTRSRIDALRIAGDLEGARKLVATLPKSSAQPESDVLLAALDLGEAEPSWPTVLERLRSAARAEQNLGRARAMLVYALARSGDRAGAKAEFERLAALPRPHPLTAPLRSFLARAEGDTKKPDADAGAANEVDEGLRLAEEARAKGDVAGALSLLEGVAKKKPGEARVLTALGDLSLQKRDRAAALRYYEQALAADKGHLPALAGLADLKWENGERQTASQLYRQIIERGGDQSPYTKRAKDRFSKFTDVLENDGRVPDDYVAPGGTADRSDLPGGGAPPKPNPTPPPTNTAPPPGVDTSDLPGLKP